jgi:hypothetical protein
MAKFDKHDVYYSKELKQAYKEQGL